MYILEQFSPVGVASSNPCIEKILHTVNVVAPGIGPSNAQPINLNLGATFIWIHETLILDP